MTIDSEALVLALLGAALIGAVSLLVQRLGKIDDTLENHGRKLVRIETKLDIADNNGGSKWHEPT